MNRRRRRLIKKRGWYDTKDPRGRHHRHKHAKVVVVKHPDEALDAIKLYAPAGKDGRWIIVAWQDDEGNRYHGGCRLFRGEFQWAVGYPHKINPDVLTMLPCCERPNAVLDICHNFPSM